MKKTWIGLDLRKDGWFFVEVCRWEKARTIKDYTYGTWPSEDIKERIADLRNILSQKVGDPRKVTVSLPLEVGFWKHYSLPPLPSSMLREAVITSSEEIGGSGEQVVVSYKECPNTSSEGKELDAFIYNQETLEKIVSFLNEAGLKDVYFSPRSCGIMNCLITPENARTRFISDAGGAKSPGDNFAYIELSNTETEIALFNKHQIIFLRSFPNPLGQNGQYNLEALIGELRLLRLMIRREHSHPPVRCYLLGSAPGIDYKVVLKEIAESLGLDEAQVGYPPLQGVIQGLGPKGITITGALAAAGLALEGMGPSTGFGIRFKHNEKEVWYQKSIFSWLAIALSVLFILGGVFFQVGIAQKEAKIEEVLVGEKKSLTAKNAFYSKLRQNRLIILWFLKEWISVVPEGTIITGLVIEGTDVKEISGYTPVFGDLYQRLLASPFLKGLQVKGGITAGPDNNEVFHLAGKLGEVNLEKKINLEKEEE